MSDWALKRFWTDVSVVEEKGGFAVRLDARGVRTPAKRPLIVPTRTIADQIASEWDAQTEKVDPTSMPWTRSANAALDKVATQRREVADHLIGYAGTDLLSYRAEAPAGLVQRQSRAWDPVLDWLDDTFDARLLTTSGVMPITQPDEAIAKLADTMTPMSDFQLTGFHDLVTLSGSFALALATARNLQPADSVWAISRIDEDWQIEQWGPDEEAIEQANAKKSAFVHATAFFFASG